MSLFHISCKKATYLVSKKEERRLSWVEAVKLRSHLSICSLCRKFEEQTAYIAKMAKQIMPENTLSSEAKKRIQTILDENKNGQQ